jgi:hypothetical protein
MVGIPISGPVLRRLREDRGWSQDGLASQGQAFAPQCWRELGPERVHHLQAGKTGPSPQPGHAEVCRGGVAPDAGRAGSASAR